MAFNAPSRLVLHSYRSYYTSADLSLQFRRRPFKHKARSPLLRTHSFSAQPPDVRRFVLTITALPFRASSPHLTATCIWFLSIGSQFMFLASSAHSVAILHLRFTSFVMIYLRKDLHLQECAHAGRTRKKARRCGLRLRGFLVLLGVSCYQVMGHPHSIINDR